MPTPVSVKSLGKLPLLATCTLAVLVPALAGAKRMSMRQVWPSKSVSPTWQLPAVTEKAEASGPTAFNKVRRTPPGPLFFNVAD